MSGTDGYARDPQEGEEAPVIERDLILRVGSVALGAWRKYCAALPDEGLMNADEIRLTGGWVALSPTFQAEGVAGYLFKVVHGDETAWINREGEFVGYDIAKILEGIREARS